MTESWKIVLDSSYMLDLNLNLNLNLNAGSLGANAFMFLVFVLLLARELISKYKNGSSILEPLCSSCW